MKTLSDWTADPEVTRRAQKILGHAFCNLRACTPGLAGSFHNDDYTGWEIADATDHELTYELVNGRYLDIGPLVGGEEFTSVQGLRVRLHHLEITDPGVRLLNELLAALYPELRQR